MMKAETKKKWLYGVLCGSGAALISLSLWFFGALDAVENVTWAWRVRMFGRNSESAAKIKLVLLDQPSLDWAANTLSVSWPWPREMYVPLLQFMQRAGAASVSFDVLYTEPSAYSVSDDEALGEAMRNTTNLVAAVFLGDRSGGSETWPPDILQRAWKVQVSDLTPRRVRRLNKSHATFPISEVATNAALLGNVRDMPDSDGVFRRASPLNRFDGRYVPSLGLAAYLLTHPDAWETSLDARRLKLGQVNIPLDSKGDVLLHYRGVRDPYERIRAAAVIQSEMNLQAGMEAELDPKVFKDCHVLFGFSAPGLMDQRATPVSRVSPGVFIHATLLDNLLDADALRDVPRHAVVLVVLLLSLLAALAGLFSRSAWRSALFYVLFLLPGVGVALLFYPLGYWYPLVVQVLSLLLALTVAVLVNYATEGRQKQFIKRAFQHYLSRDVIENILNDPGRLKLGGERKVLTIFFSDIQGFSTISERMNPQELTAFLNEYLSEMTDIIFQEGGTLDKYEGDAIIAFWNAPMDQHDHALRGCRAALRCANRLEELRADFAKRYGSPLYARIGMHTGEVVVGNMGSKERFDYTVLGDAANLASRLEGANKAFGTYIMVSGETWSAVEGQLSARQIGRIRVVGRKTPVNVYELLTLNPNERPDWVRTFEEGLVCVFSNDWKNAMEKFQSLEKDPPAAKYLARCREALKGSDWDGVWNLTEK
ncbi:MAG: adenylate/guanylate cyclase domain-containing protein [Kiritimatiellae bacterium]|nr:adenylate/guanylate cyclase domain-containing protein [Kiritimatiellia bacterium]